MAVALAALVLGAGALAAPPAQAATPLAFLDRAQNSDGGFGAAPRTSSTQLHTGWTALGLAAAGRNPRDVTRGSRSPIDFMRQGIRTLDDTGELERTILVLTASGVSPRAFGGRNLVAQLQRRQRGDGSFGGFVSFTSFGVLALRSAGLPASSPSIRRAAAWLARQQNRDGGFSFAQRGGASGVDDTSGPLQALRAAGRGGGTAAVRAYAFLRRAQNPDGGFPLSPGGQSNAQSTAWAIQGAIAAGANPAALRRGASRSAAAYLRSLLTDDGSVRYSRTSAQTPVWVTGQALVAFAGKAFPLAPVRRRAAASAASGGGGEAASGGPAAAAGGAPAAPRPNRKEGSRMASEQGNPPAGGAGVSNAEVLELARLAGTAAGLLMAPVR